VEGLNNQMDMSFGRIFCICLLVAAVVNGFIGEYARVVLRDLKKQEEHKVE